jgi:DNA-binding NtrC family response regulator
MTTTTRSIPDGLALAGTSTAIRHLLRAVDSLGNAQCNVLICGEAGLAVQQWVTAVHARGPQRRALVTVPLATTKPEELERLMLRGLLDQCSADAPRTVHLAGVDALDRRQQARLLQVLRQIPRTPRLVSTAGALLEREICLGGFDRELYRYLAAIQLNVPALRERREDIPIIARLVNASWDNGVRRDLAGPAVDELCKYPWPGNIEELVGVVAFARDGSRSRDISAARIRAALGSRPRRHAAHDIQRLRQIERDYIRATLARFDGNQARTANALGIGRGTLVRKLRESRRAEHAAHSAATISGTPLQAALG